MVSSLNDIIRKADFTSEEDSRAVVFICANHPSFDLPFALLTRYPVFETYSEYWEKGAGIIRRNTGLLDEIRRQAPDAVPAAEVAKEAVTRGERVRFQKKAIKKYLKSYPVKKSVLKN